MKKVFRFFAFFAAFMMALALVGCSDDSSSDDKKSSNSSTSSTNSSSSSTTDVVAGNSYKTTSAKMGTSSSKLNEGVDSSNYCTIVFASTGNSWTLTSTGSRMSMMEGGGTYSISGTSLTLSETSGTMKGATIKATVTSDGSTLTFPVQKVADNVYISATYVKQ